MKKWFARYLEYLKNLSLLMLIGGIAIGAVMLIKNPDRFGIEYMTFMIALIILPAFYASFPDNTSMIDTYDLRIMGGAFRGKSKADREFRDALIKHANSHLLEALDGYKELLDCNMSDEERGVLNFYIGRCYQTMGYPANAAKFFREAEAAGMTNNELYLYTARNYGAMGEYETAEEYFSRLIGNPAYETILCDMGMMYIKKGDGERALECFQKSMREGKEYNFCLGGCAIAYLLMGDMENSKKYYEQAILSNTDNDGFKSYYADVAALNNTEIKKNETLTEG